MRLGTTLAPDDLTFTEILPAGQPFVHLPAAVLDNVVRNDPDRTTFIRSWDRLPVDQHLRDKGRYRRRRYSRFRAIGCELIAQPHNSFFQTADVNAVNGGAPRLFAPIEPAVAGSATLRRIVLALQDRLPGASDPAELACGVHQIRITASTSTSGSPTPEGIHRDGHHFVGQVLIHRGAISGGESRIYDLEKSPIYRTTLRSPLEAIVIDDRRVLHSVEPIRAVSDTSSAVRDMLLVDFFSAGYNSPI